MDELTSELMATFDLGEFDEIINDKPAADNTDDTSSPEDDATPATTSPSPDDPTAATSTDPAEPPTPPAPTAASTKPAARAAMGPQLIAAVHTFMANKPGRVEPSVGASYLLTSAPLPNSYADLCQFAQRVCQFLKHTIGVSAYVAQLQVSRARERERKRIWCAHTGGGNALAFKQPT